MSNKKEHIGKPESKIVSGFAIGIDLGTTYSCVGVMRQGKVEIIGKPVIAVHVNVKKLGISGSACSSHRALLMHLLTNVNVLLCSKQSRQSHHTELRCLHRHGASRR